MSYGGFLSIPLQRVRRPRTTSSRPARCRRERSTGRHRRRRDARGSSPGERATRTAVASGPVHRGTAANDESRPEDRSVRPLVRAVGGDHGFVAGGLPWPPRPRWVSQSVPVDRLGRGSTPGVRSETDLRHRPELRRDRYVPGCAGTDGCTPARSSSLLACECKPDLSASLFSNLKW